jgi:SAM-dependent methyltransferase
MIFQKLKLAIRRILPRAYSVYRDNRNREVHFRKFLKNMPDRICPICDFRGKFLHWAGIPVVSESVCPQCLSQSRHRLLHLWLGSSISGKLEGRLLHVAPERQLEDFVKKRFKERVTIDLLREDVDVRADLTCTDFESQTFRTVWASHVLEHISNDVDALREIHRLLLPGGAFVVLVPIVEAWKNTEEDRGLTSPEQRELYYGLFDHVRIYGSDFRSRVEKVGFALDYEYAASIKQCVLYSIIYGEKVFVFKKLTEEARDDSCKI